MSSLLRGRAIRANFSAFDRTMQLFFIQFLGKVLSLIDFAWDGEVGSY